MNWNDGSEDYNKIAKLEARISKIHRLITLALCAGEIPTGAVATKKHLYDALKEAEQ